MSNKAMAWAVDCTVGRSHKLILMLLAECHNGSTGDCFPRQDWLAEKSGYSESTVSAALLDLENWGLITRETARLGRGKGSRTDYVLHLDILDPRIIDLYSSELTPPIKPPLDPRLSGVSSKEEPESNRKEPERRNGKASDILEEVWKAGPKVSRERSGKKPLLAALESILKSRKDVTADQLRDAWLAFLDTKDAKRDGGEYVKGIHLWYKGGRFEAFLPDKAAAAALPLDGPPIDLQRCFYQYGRGGAWQGMHHGYPVEPDAAAAVGIYPEELYSKFSVQRPKERSK